MCQRPKRAFSISTQVKTVTQRQNITSVNALNGLFPFLQKTNGAKAMSGLTCQRPKRAFSISTTEEELKSLFSEGCQRPKRAFSISTKGRDNLHLLHLWCPRPKRAFSISADTIILGPNARYVSTPETGFFQFYQK